MGKGIALLFHDRGTRREQVVSSTPCPHFTPEKDPVPILQEAGWAPGPVWTGGKSRPHRDSIADRPARSQSLYRLSYPTPCLLNNFLKITGILNEVFRPQRNVRKTRIKPCNTLALTVLFYGSETWTMKARDARRITAAEIEFEKNSKIYLGQITKQMHKLQRS